MAPASPKRTILLVEDDAFEVGEVGRRAVPGAEQGQLLRRGQQDVGREVALTLAFGLFGVAGAGLDVDVQPDLADRGRQIAFDVGGQRLQRRQIQGMHARPRPVLRPWPPFGELALQFAAQAERRTRASLADIEDGGIGVGNLGSL